MNNEPMEKLISIVETWQVKRVPLAEKFSQDSLREFAETHNALARQMISVLDKRDPLFFSALMELAQHASGMVEGARFFVNKTDRTNL